MPGDAINRNRRITTLYAQMYNSEPDVFKWAGMAALASQLVGDGMAAANEARIFPHIPLFGPDPNVGYQLLGQGNLDLFMNMYPQTLAYRDGGIAAIRTMLEGDPARLNQLRAWEKIATGQQTGNQQLVWDGNQDLLEFEQRVTLQNGIYAGHLAFWENVTNTWNFLVPPITSPIPGDDSTFQSFRDDSDAADVADDASIGDFDSRWAWVIRRQYPAYRIWSDANQVIDLKKLLSGGYK